MEPSSIEVKPNSIKDLLAKLKKNEGRARVYLTEELFKKGKIVDCDEQFISFVPDGDKEGELIFISKIYIIKPINKDDEEDTREDIRDLHKTSAS